MNKVFSLAALFAAAAFFGCNRGEDPQVQPSYPATNGMVSFRVDNNQVWAAQGTISGSGLLSAQSGATRLEIQLSSPGTGQYQLTSSPQPAIFLNDFGSPAIDYVSFTCNPAGGVVRITENTGTHITGTFEGRICSGGQQIQITEGVFTRIPF